jgi:hypothetical protein
LPNDERGQSPPVTLDLAGFELERAIFEVRYSPAFLLWDRAGQLWTEAREKWPGLEVLRAQPDITVFRVGLNQQMAVELAAARIIVHRPELPLTEFTEASKSFLEIVTRQLGLITLSRVGLRLVFYRAFPNRDSAGSAFLGTGLISLPEGRFFGTEGAPVVGECGLTWETKGVGVRASVGYQHREFKVEAGPDLPEAASKEFKSDGIVFDIDFYTIATIEVGQLGVGEWVEQHVRALKRDTDGFLGGIGR